MLVIIMNNDNVLLRLSKKERVVDFMGDPFDLKRIFASRCFLKISLSSQSRTMNYSNECSFRSPQKNIGGN